MLIYPLIPCFTLSSVFYPLIRVLPSHPCFTLSSVFYPLIRVLPSHPCFTLSSVFYPLIRVLPSHPSFTLSSVFYPLIRVLPSHPCFILSSVRPSGVCTFIRSAFYPNPLLTAKLVDNLEQAVRRQLVDGLSTDLLQVVRFLRV